MKRHAPTNAPTRRIPVVKLYPKWGHWAHAGAFVSSCTAVVAQGKSPENSWQSQRGNCGPSPTRQRPALHRPETASCLQSPGPARRSPGGQRQRPKFDAKQPRKPSSIAHFLGNGPPAPPDRRRCTGRCPEVGGCEGNRVLKGLGHGRAMGSRGQSLCAEVQVCVPTPRQTPPPPLRPFVPTARQPSAPLWANRLWAQKDDETTFALRFFCSFERRTALFLHSEHCRPYPGRTNIVKPSMPPPPPQVLSRSPPPPHGNVPDARAGLRPASRDVLR